MVFTMKEKH